MKKYVILMAVIALFSCNTKKETNIVLLDKTAFEKEMDGKQVSLYTLDSGNGLVVQVTNYGLRVVSIWAPDKNGTYADVAIGYESIDRYIGKGSDRFIGPVVGRFANRIAKGKFELDGVQYQLPINNNGQTLHGGHKGIDMRVWNVDKVTDKSIDFSYVSSDGEEGFPGTLTIRVNYSVTDNGEFKITYKATTGKPTFVNLSNHAIFNLRGEAGGKITDQILTIKANYITPVDSVLIPTGKLFPVENSPFDFRKPTAIGDRIEAKDIQLKYGLGYDHNWVLDKTEKGVELVASLYEPESGRLMEIFTDQPGLQFYSGNFFNGKTSGKYGNPINYREGVALETQKFPDTPNHPNFPSARLNPGEEYSHTCIYKFSVK